MRVIATIPVFNEAEFLPLQIAYLRQQGVDIHVIDNESTDGSRAICESLGVTVTSLVTGGAFDLTAIQKERARVAASYQHDWHLYGDADEWNLFADGIVGVCLAAEAQGANVIRTSSYNLYYTGEKRSVDPRHGFYYGALRYSGCGGITRLHRRGNFRYHGDAIQGAGLKEYQPGIAAMNLNFGGTKPAAARVETLKRRKVAWERGLRRSFGAYMLDAEQRDYTWDRSSLTYLPETPHWPLAREVIEPPANNNGN